MVYAFELLKYVKGRREPVVAGFLSSYFANDDAAKAHALRLLLESAGRDGVFACRMLQAEGALVATLISGESAA